MPSPFISVICFRDEGMIHFFYRSHAKEPESGLFFWLDRKQYGWFALLRLAKMPPSVSCCWLQSAFLLACKWAVNTHASSLSNFCRLSFLWIYVKFEECLNRNFIQSFECNLIRAASYRGDKQVHLFMIGILTWFDGNSSFRNLRIILRDLRFHDTFQFIQPNFFFQCFRHKTKSTSF